MRVNAYSIQRRITLGPLLVGQKRIFVLISFARLSSYKNCLSSFDIIQIKKKHIFNKSSLSCYRDKELQKFSSNINNSSYTTSLNCDTKYKLIFFYYINIIFKLKKSMQIKSISMIQYFFECLSKSNLKPFGINLFRDILSNLSQLKRS